MSFLAELDRLAAASSERPWRPAEHEGRKYGAVVTDGRSLVHMDEENRRAYGGGLIFESCASADQEFVCALVNAWPSIRPLVAAMEAPVETSREGDA